MVGTGAAGGGGGGMTGGTYERGKGRGRDCEKRDPVMGDEEAGG